MKGLGVVLLALSVVVADAQSLRSQIDASNRSIERLMMARDVKGLTKTMKGMVTLDFKYVEAGRSENIDTMNAGMAMGLGQMKMLKRAETKTLTLKEKGSSATATTLHVMEGTTIGGDKKPHTISFSGTSEDTYVKQGGKWKLSRMAWLKQTMAMDGKPIPAR